MGESPAPYGTGREVLAECMSVDAGGAVVVVMGERDELCHIVAAMALATALDMPVEALPGTEFIATLRESLEDGQVLSGFRRVEVPGE